jgi:hypothetical protein
VKADQERRSCRAKLGELRRLGLLGRFDFEVDNLAARHCGIRQDRQLRRQCPNEAAAKLLAATGGNCGHVFVLGEKLSQVGQCDCRLGQRIEAKFKKADIFERRLRAIHHFGGGLGLNGDA